MKTQPLLCSGWACVVLSVVLCTGLNAQTIPLPEHPRPDFQRPAWLNLNGPWEFQFDPQQHGITYRWHRSATPFTHQIQVPFSWASPLSGVADVNQADIGWYARSLTIPTAWQGQRIFLVIGACDWHTTVWLDGHPLGEHQGGYTPFEFELTAHHKPGKEQRLVLRVDDSAHPFKLEGKQGYGRAAGIWQTLYLEARPKLALDTIHFSPDIDQERVTVAVQLDHPATKDLTFEIHFKKQDRTETIFTQSISRNSLYFMCDIPLKKPRLWSLEDPYLYEVQVLLKGDDWQDQVSTYFGMRKISTGPLPGTNLPYVLLNNQPVYLQMVLDQAYHPEGFYTFPNDAFLRDEILRSRRIGLNGHRVHVKVPLPRKLYWADRLGLLIMADVPNSWGSPDVRMQNETEYALRQMIKRDYNHPSIFSWVNFNETWGLKTGTGEKRAYSAETQDWVDYIYQLTKQMDATRLVEDNSPCHNDHVSTDLNTWHAYRPGYAWQAELEKVCAQTHSGSTWNFIGARQQEQQPMFNSECGNVWGYEGGTGDIDWSWDYHLMMNAFRRHPRCSGWLYTQHHDVINEWNGYWRYNRTEKYTGLEDLVPGMSLRDLHSPFYLALDPELCREIQPAAALEVPLFLSVHTDQAIGQHLYLEAALYGWDSLGQRLTFWSSQREIPYHPWQQANLKPLKLTAPEEPCLSVLTVQLRDISGHVLHRNFTTYLVSTDPNTTSSAPATSSRHLVRFDPNSFTKAHWSEKQWTVLDGLKVNGTGSGYFEYEIPWPADLTLEQVDQVTLRLELSAKQRFGKDRDTKEKQTGDFMRGQGTHDPSLNPNAYPMTDETPYPSHVQIQVNGLSAGIFDLPDDPADHRGILSWFSQRRDKHLHEAGSYGYLINAVLPPEALRQAHQVGVLKLRFNVDDTLPGGLAIYGQRFGRYPLDPTLIFSLR